MTDITIILFFGFIAAFAEIIGAAIVLLRQRWPRKFQEYLLALGAGFILALVFSELIPRSFDAIGAIAAVFIILGYAVIHLFEHTIVGHLHFGEETHHDVMVSKIASLSAYAGLFVHAFFDGLSISVGMHFNYLVGLLIFIAVLLHKIPEGMTIASIMLSADHTKKFRLWASYSLGAATMLGACMIFILTNVDVRITGIAFAFSAGTGAYVGATDLVPEINKSENRLAPIIVLIGMLLFYGTLRGLEIVAGIHTH
ncbi:MAG: ZIP family metal transporter [Bacteroidota bacterium]